MCQDPVLGGRRRGIGHGTGPFLPPHTHSQGGCPCLLLQGRSPGTMLGEAKGTAWPESCWSLVTCAKEGQESEEAWFRKGSLGLWLLTSAGVTAPY